MNEIPDEKPKKKKKMYTCGPGWQTASDKEGGKRYKGCGQAFGTQHRLIRHVRTHTKHKPFRCKYVDPKTNERCTKSFKQKGSLPKHMVTHTEARFVVKSVVRTKESVSLGDRAMGSFCAKPGVERPNTRSCPSCAARCGEGAGRACAH